MGEPLKDKERMNPKQIKFYCKNPLCFVHYIANHKLIDTPKEGK